MAKTTSRLDDHDKQIAAIRKLISTGMKMLVRNERRIDKLTSAQLKTDQQIRETQKTLNRFIRSLGERNGSA